MSFPSVKLKSKGFIALILLVQFAVYVTMFLDAPVARQVIGFLYLTFFPGFVIIKVLKLHDLDRLETILLSVGSSVAFLILAGFLVDEFFFLFGISRPLSLMPLMIVLNVFILVGAILASLRSDGATLWEVETLGLDPLTLLLICLPLLSVVGAMWVNGFSNNLILFLMLVVIPLLFLIGVISKKLLPPKVFPLAVIMIAISLLYHSSLVSNYVVSFGSDLPGEYFVFETVKDNAYWSSTNPYPGDIARGRVYSMLSVTVLPATYSSLLNIDSTLMFKILFPMIFSFVPLGLYELWKEYVGKKYAFVSAFLFMAEQTFYTEMLGLSRQMVAELFFVLLLLVILNKKLRPSSKTFFFMIFSFSLITSHYGLSEIFLFFISLTSILSGIKRPSRNVTSSMVAFFFIIMFAWYIYTTGSAVFDSILQYGEYVRGQFGNFFNPASRGQTVLRGLGLESPPTIWNAISRAFAYATEFLIVVGFVGLMTKRVEVYTEMDWFIFTFIAMAFLVTLILVPGLANTLNMTRFYHVLLFFLAPLCLMGAEFLVKLVSKRNEESLVCILVLIVLIPYFLFQTSFVYEVTGSESWSLPLSKYRMSGFQLYNSLGYIGDRSVFSAQWMQKSVDARRTQIYADRPSMYNALSSYGHIYAGDVELLSNATTVSTNGIVYLTTLNIIHGVIVGNYYTFALNELSFLDEMNKVYSNGGSEIYKTSIGD